MATMSTEETSVHKGSEPANRSSLRLRDVPRSAAREMTVEEASETLRDMVRTPDFDREALRQTVASFGATLITLVCHSLNVLQLQF